MLTSWPCDTISRPWIFAMECSFLVGVQRYALWLAIFAFLCEGQMCNGTLTCHSGINFEFLAKAIGAWGSISTCKIMCIFLAKYSHWPALCHAAQLVSLCLLLTCGVAAGRPLVLCHAA
uniref:Uncharacterized protein n=1 Tax=Arundo donax TaxID=35708 RepID=A0A0A9B659_ARUDO